MLTHDDILPKLTEILTNLFEVPAEDITLEANLYEDLDLDSIDAVDLAIKLQEFTGKKIAPEEFKSVRTVNDVVAQVQTLIDAPI
ncbi:acyl carrier protein [Halocynthiibacter namhaensis]|uniref:acyl carrier protein n=1 Tax=Halocynthiibacter namhaensis TaxID=1290553 RepID=UPI00057993B7|nr:acyl carrier protein [Halocynthiibacter namhaensis]